MIGRIDVKAGRNAFHDTWGGDWAQNCVLMAVATRSHDIRTAGGWADPNHIRQSASTPSRRCGHQFAWCMDKNQWQRIISSL